MTIQLRGDYNQIHVGKDNQYEYYLSLQDEQLHEFGMVIIKTINKLPLREIFFGKIDPVNQEGLKGKIITLEAKDEGTWLIFDSSHYIVGDDHEPSLGQKSLSFYYPDQGPDDKQLFRLY